MLQHKILNLDVQNDMFTNTPSVLVGDHVPYLLFQLAFVVVQTIHFCYVKTVNMRRVRFDFSTTLFKLLDGYSGLGNNITEYFYLYT